MSEPVDRAWEHLRTGTTDMAASELRVPLSYYRDDAQFRRECELLHTTPLAVVPSCRVSEPYDYIVRDVMGSSVLVTRDADGSARGFLNYCRHRGARVAGGCGSARRHACPYHGWTYDSAGALVGIPGREGFDGIDPADHGLVELPTEERHGFVWLVLTAGASIDVAAHLGELDAELASWGHEGFTFFDERRLDPAVNWKAALEAFAESYHFPYVHGQSLVGQNTVANTAVFDSYGAHHRLCFPLSWAAGNESDPNASGALLDNLAIIYWVFPNLVLAHSAVGVEIIDILPATSPEDCTVLHSWMAREAPSDDRTRAGYADLFEAVHAALRDEDVAVLTSCGQGIRAAQHDHMVIGRNEIGVQHVVRTFAAETGVAIGGA